MLARSWSHDRAARRVHVSAAPWPCSRSCRTMDGGPREPTPKHCPGWFRPRPPFGRGWCGAPGGARSWLGRPIWPNPSPGSTQRRPLSDRRVAGDRRLDLVRNPGFAGPAPSIRRSTCMCTPAGDLNHAFADFAPAGSISPASRRARSRSANPIRGWPAGLISQPRLELVAVGIGKLTAGVGMRSRWRRPPRHRRPTSRRARASPPTG